MFFPEKGRRFFITGTDTHVGKTYCTLKLLAHYQQQGKIAIAMKPVASGALSTSHGLQNEDARLLREANSLPLSYEKVNPYLFALPIAPHLAAREEGRALEAHEVASHIESFLRIPADVHLIEGVGGWKVPLNETETMASVVQQLDVEVILVVSLRLGCLNHALLTYEAIEHSGCSVAGWIANCMESAFPYLQENINTLIERLPSPLLASLACI